MDADTSSPDSRDDTEEAEDFAGRFRRFDLPFERRFLASRRERAIDRFLLGKDRGDTATGRGRDDTA